jgi:FtsP/CotA-like multicopper oxidase with cupredoxin domain
MFRAFHGAILGPASPYRRREGGVSDICPDVHGSPIQWRFAVLPVRVTEGDKIRVVLKNELPEPTVIHIHGPSGRL